MVRSNIVPPVPCHFVCFDGIEGCGHLFMLPPPPPKLVDQRVPLSVY